MIKHLAMLESVCLKQNVFIECIIDISESIPIFWVIDMECNNTDMSVKLVIFVLQKIKICHTFLPSDLLTFGRVRVSPATPPHTLYIYGCVNEYYLDKCNMNSFKRDYI